MPGFKTDHNVLHLLPINFGRQLLSGTLDRARCYLDDYQLDLSDVHSRDDNYVENAPTYDLCVLLKIERPAYSHGNSSMQSPFSGHDATPTKAIK